MINTLRRIKRKLFTGGFAETVYLFLKEIETGDGIFQHPENTHLVNLSFDFELGFGTTFWEGNIEKALSYGKTARKNFIPITTYLRDENIPANIQVVGALLGSNVSVLPIFNEREQNVVSKNSDLFQLTNEDTELLKASNIETGLHGFSHRHFTAISPEDADYEMSNATTNFIKHFGRKPEFMAFPKNRVAHTDIIDKYGIKCWRANTQKPTNLSEIPLGHWLALGVLGQSDLKKLLDILKNTRTGFLLHLWGHFTEMDVATFR